MTKHYFGDKIPEAKEGDIIYFDMPSMCSGEYKAKVCKDEFGLYIDESDNFYDSCYDYRINKPYWAENYQ